MSQQVTSLGIMDTTDVAMVEATLTEMPVDDALKIIRGKGGKFFSATFERKNDKKVGGVVVAKAGSIRKMLCRMSVSRYVQGTGNGNRAAEDAANGVLTVWDVSAYQTARRKGKDQEAAGRSAYRRINMTKVIAISA